jgi:hypothetical protein
VSPSTSSESYSEKARRHILNGETAEGLSLFREDEGGATPLFGVNLSIGWADHIVASGMYHHDARGVACARAETFDCVAEDEDGTAL